MTAAGVLYDLSHVDAHFPPAGADKGCTPFWVTATIDDVLMLDHAADKLILAGPFPSVAYILNSPGSLVAYATNICADDLDVSFGFGGTDGVLDFSMIAVTDCGKAASTTDPAVTIDAELPWLDIGGLYLIADIVTAATTPAVGTFQLAGWFTQNVVHSVPI
jgi:hypothetical protein